MSIIVSAPWGGFANHTTWLLWIHPEFKSGIQKRPFTQEDFDIARGEEWPDINDLESVTDPSIKEELENLRYIDIFPEDPVQYILDNVYTEDRSWHNWLSKEWNYRTDLHNFEISHNFEIASIAHTDHTVLCTVDPEVAYKNYFKLNSSFNMCGIDKFKKIVKKYNDEASNSTNLVIDNTALWNSELDPNYYQKLAEYFSLDNLYPQAQVIHDAWYRAQIRSETDFLKEVERIYK